MRPDRRHDPALREQREQADRLDQHGLAAGVGTGDQDRELVGVQLEIERDGMIEQRMPSPANLQVPANLRHEPVDLHGVPRPRTQIVERDAHLPRRGDRRGMGAQQVCQLAQYAQHFAQLGGLGGTQLVAELDDLGRLDEHGVARRGLVMDDAAHARSRRGADRNHVAPAAHRDRRVGRALGLIERSQNGAQLVHHVLAGVAHALARAGKIL